jgi:thioredoxin 1
MDELAAIRAKKQADLEAHVKVESPAKAPTAPVHITDGEYAAFIARHENVIVDFYADWCGPCRMLGPTLEVVAKEYGGKVAIAKINVDTDGTVASSFGVQSIPTLAFIKKGKPVSVAVGGCGKDALKRQIAQHLGVS